MKAEIIDEVWKPKDSISAAHGYDMKRLVASLRAREKASATRIRSYSTSKVSQKATLSIGLRVAAWRSGGVSASSAG